MIPKYIENWLTIIEQMNNDNTYKLAWGRAILESVLQNRFEVKDTVIQIDFKDISRFMLKYYWNQIFFFNLKQAPYLDKEPVICKYTKEAIEQYKKINDSAIPVWFDKAELFFRNNESYYQKLISRISSILHQNVSYRFMNVGKEKIKIYDYEKKKGSFIQIEYSNMLLLQEYSVVLSELLNYKWSQLLEQFNFQPKISSKVKGISEAKLKRNSLVKYKEILIDEFKDGHIIDFYTGLEIRDNEISVDHVIPWSFMYSDDIWNLVVTTKSENSSKNNTIPSKEIVSRLKERNHRLIGLVEDEKTIKELKMAEEMDYIDKFYFDCQL